MYTNLTPAKRLSNLLALAKPLQIVGVINAYCALLAQHVGIQALYLSGAGVANASLGYPDLGLINGTDVLIDLQRITQVCKLPIIVDIDTGWGSTLAIHRHVKALEQAGAAALQIEDQIDNKRCGHRDGKQIVAIEIMCQRIAAAKAAACDKDLHILARSDALASEGLEQTCIRLEKYIAAGASLVFPEAVTSLAQYQYFTQNLTAPVLANITEFGKTPLFTAAELHQVGVSMVLYPLSGFRAMSKAAESVYKTIKQQGTQANCINKMQTRAELYNRLDYLSCEQVIDHNINNKDK